MSSSYPDRRLLTRVRRQRPSCRRRAALAAAGVAALVALIAAGAPGAAALATSDDELPDDLVVCLAEARRANGSHDIERERRLLEHAERLSGQPEDLAEVQRRLAVLDWRYHHRFEAARERLDKALGGAEPSAAWAAIGRLEQARRSYRAAARASRQALATAKSENERLDALLAEARAVVADSVARHRQEAAGADLSGGATTLSAAASDSGPNDGPSSDVADQGALRSVFASLDSFVRAEPGLLEPSLLLLRAALLLDVGDAALVALRSYYHVAEGGSMPNAIAAAGKVLGRILPAWPGSAATAAQRIELVSALAASRFFAEAAIVARGPRADEAVRSHAEVGAILAYADAIDRIRELTEESYRSTILGKRDPAALRKGVEGELAAVVRAIEGETSKASSSFERVREALDERFGAYVNLNVTAGYFDLHMGHRVVDERRTIEQYGRRTELRFVALDTMVSNGFQTWAWEGGAQHGGWAGRDVIFQVRSAYVGGPLQTWRSLHDPDEARELEEEIARETARDDERARQDPYGHLPGLALRLEQQGLRLLLGRLEGEGASGADLRARFLAEMERVQQESSIFAHEGRHAIDKQIGSKGNPELTAKLSEVAFAPAPRLALGAIFDGPIADSTPHGKANLQIMKGLVAWMNEHREQIAGLDPSRPLLPQFDLLTDEQMRAAFRSMDPLATEDG